MKNPQPKKISEKYKDVVSKIADSLLAGLVCYFNPYTLEVEDIPEFMVHDTDEYELMKGEPGNSIENGFED